MEAFNSQLERWDLYPFGERSPSKIWDRVAGHPAWTPSLAQLTPQFLPAYQIEDDRLVTNLISTVWGERVSATAIRVAAYLFARVQTRGGERGLRVLRCLAYRDDRPALYKKIFAYLVGLGMIHRCARIEWEILEPGEVAVPATFDLIGPCNDEGLKEFLAGRGFRAERRWVYRRGPLARSGPTPAEPGRADGLEDHWKEYSGRYFRPLLPDPPPGLERKHLGRFLPRGTGDTLFRPFGPGGPAGQWVPDLAPLVEDLGRWDEARTRVNTIRLLRLFPVGEGKTAAGRPLRLPGSIRDRFPNAAHLQIGPLPEEDESLAGLLDGAGYPPFATLTLLAFPL